MGKEFVEKMRFCPDIEKIKTRLSQIEDFLSLLQNGVPFPIRDYNDLRSDFRHLSIEGTVISVESLFALKPTLTALSYVLNFFKSESADRVKSLKALAAGIEIDRHLFTEITRLIDDKGEIIPMDLFTALIAQDILSGGPATILYDLRSSRAVPECIRENGGTAIQSRVGHAFIKAQMRENDAVFAGELSGHYYFKQNFTAKSQGLAFIMLANLISKKAVPVSELVAPLRKYFSSGEINSKVKDVAPILAELKSKYADGNMYELDGISSEYSNWWFNVRASNTEPLLRLIVEADTKELMEAKRDELL
jgi:hypothetical protein